MKRFRLGVGLGTILFALSAGLATAAHSYYASSDRPQARVVFSEGAHLVMMNIDGTGRHTLASAGATGAFAWYSWSPDGQYLQVSKSLPQGGASSILLYNRDGRYVRTLVKRAPWAGLYPGWAVDGDRLAYVSGVCSSSPQALGRCASSTDQAVFSVGVDGRREFLASYGTQAAGCGGGVQDPAADLYRVETDFGASMQPIVWKIGQPLRLLNALGLVRLSAASRAGGGIQHPSQIALSANGAMVGVIQHCGAKGCIPSVALLNAKSGAVLRVVSRGEMPTWSRDGQTIYFVMRSLARQLPFRDALGHDLSSQSYRTSLWRAAADGSHPVQLWSERAFGFGPLTISPDGSALVFSRVANSDNLWSHRLAGNRYNPHLVRLYGPTVSVQRFDLATGRVAALGPAGRPTVQP